MKLVYFAWIRERIGRFDEEIELPRNVETVADLIAWLRSRGEEYEYALAEPAAVRTAIDKFHALPQDRLAGASEIAFFPPMTGG